MPMAAPQATPSVAMVTPRGVRNITSRGTAFVIDFPGAEGDSSVYLLTAAHVAAPGTRLEVSFVGAADKAGVPQRGSGSPAMIPAEVVSRAGGADVALIKVRPLARRSAPRASPPRDPFPRAGQEVRRGCGRGGGGGGRSPARAPRGRAAARGAGVLVRLRGRRPRAGADDGHSLRHLRRLL